MNTKTTKFEDGKKYTGSLIHAEILDSSSLETFEARFIFLGDNGEKIDKPFSNLINRLSSGVYMDDLRRMGHEIRTMADAVNVTREIRKTKPRVEVDIERGGKLRHVLRRLKEEAPAPELNLAAETETATATAAAAAAPVANSGNGAPVSAYELKKREKYLRLKPPRQRKLLRDFEDLRYCFNPAEYSFSEEELRATISRLRQALEEFEEGLG